MVMFTVDRARQSFRQSLRNPLRSRGMRVTQSTHLTPPTAEEGDEEDPVRARSMELRLQNPVIPLLPVVV